MIAVVASPWDEAARAFVRFAAGRAALLTPGDLSTPGWRYEPENGGSSVAVVDGRTVPVTDISGVLTRLPAVLGHQLLRIAPDDRAYVAAEMTAFLVAWLSALSCPVLNPPTSGCLSGPGWRPEQWQVAAAGLGLAVTPLRRAVSLPDRGLMPPGHADGSPSRGTAVTIVGSRCLGSNDEALRCHAMALAAAAGVELVTVRFTETPTGFCFAGVDLWPDIGEAAITDAVLEHFCKAAEADTGASRR